MLPCTPYEWCDISTSMLFTRSGWCRALFPKSKWMPMQLCSSARGAGTGKNSTTKLSVLLRHLTKRHIPTMVPEKCAKRVEDLTKMIVRTYAYPVAYGGFSDIWSCLLRHLHSPPEKVAVKAIRPVIANAKEYQVKEKAVEQELRVWARLKHQNVLPLYGIAHEFGPLPAFVCPWADNGTLSEYLDKFETQLNLKKRMTLLNDIAAGLQYLHSHDIIHGDLSGSNILITNSGKAWLSDFGLSTLMEQVSDTEISGFCFPGNIRWAAPELLCTEDRETSRLSSKKVDVYSFGSIMLQVLSGKLPFHRIHKVSEIVIMIWRGYRPPRECGWDGKDIPDVLWKFVETCWASPDKRPSSTKIVNFIRDQLSRL